MNPSTKYGHFSQNGMEYIITRPDTPRPWINILTNGRYTSLISHTGGGFSFLDDPTYNRITRAIPGEAITADRPGRYIYLRDNDSGEYWSLNWQPVMKTADFWEARVGIGYNKIISVYKGIQAEVTYFVPKTDNLEVWQIKIKNLTQGKRNISVTAYVEWVLGNFDKDLSDRVFDSLFNDVYFKDNIIFASKRRWEIPGKPGQPWKYTAYLSGDVVFECYDCVKEDFVGQYRYLSNPVVIERGMCKTAYGKSEDAIGALMKIIPLDPNGEVEFNIFLGIEESKKDIISRIKKYSRPGFVRKKFNELIKFWQDYLSSQTVKTPDSDFDLSVNIWNKYQTYITANLGEMISYYIGSGSFGFRDESQHILGVLPVDSEFVKKKLILLLEHQLEEGKTVHNWKPTSLEAVITEHSDDSGWLVMAIIYYLNETGDLGFLEERVKYFDKSSGTVLEHLLKALDYVLYHVSPDGLPLRRTADWNDALAGGHLGKGESMMVANQICWNISGLLPILRKIGKEDLADRYEHVYERIKYVLNHYHWDGEWYVRATDENGNPIGSKKNKEGKIHLDGQTWPVMSGVADKERGIKAMDSVWKHLSTPYGLLICHPSYTHVSKNLGIISQFAPGTKENGAIFMHLNAWAIIAETLLGRSEKAFDLWKRTSFITLGKNPDVYATEPYVYPEFIYGPENLHFGSGSYTWMTGSAAWFFRACTDYILGVRPTIDGLLVDPCIPKNWKEFSIIRRFRGAEYRIKVKNPDSFSKGIKEIRVNGKKLEGNKLPVFEKGIHEIEVVMGKSNQLSKESKSIDKLKVVEKLRIQDS